MRAACANLQCHVLELEVNAAGGIPGLGRLQLGGTATQIP
jgi:hypothetical protein